MKQSPLRPTSKTCNYGTCSQPVWSNGKCKYHQEKKTFLKSHSPNRKVHDQYGYKTEKEMFQDIYEKRCKPVFVSEISGRKITCEYGSVGWYMCFAHILNKGSYPWYKLNPDNIMVAHPDEHMLIDAGTIAQREDYEKEHNCSFDVFYNKQEKLREQYGRDII